MLVPTGRLVRLGLPVQGGTGLVGVRFWDWAAIALTRARNGTVAWKIFILRIG